MRFGLTVACVATFSVFAMGGEARADIVETFKSVCMANLGNPKGIATAAERQGFKSSPAGELMGGYMAIRQKTDETVQVNIATRHKFECAVTTSDVAQPEQLRVRFFQSLGISTKNSSVKAKVGGQTYVFKFDTSGGEALVVYR